MEPRSSTPVDPDDLRAFLLVLRRALLMIVGFVERRYPDSVN